MLTLSMGSPVQAQDFAGISTRLTTGTSYHIFAKEGEATLQVLVLGSVGSPGVYEVGVATDLGQLLALTGGPPLESTTGSVRRSSEVTVRLFREEAGRRNLVYEAALERMLVEPGLYPALQDGDVFAVERITVERQRFGWREGLSLLSGLASLGLLIERFGR